MRIWSVHPKYLDRKGLLAVWREGLLAKERMSWKAKPPAMLLNNNPKIIENVTGKKLGRIEKGFPADLIVIDYVPPTPLSKDNFLGHLIFGMVDATVDTVICNGKTLMRDKKLEGINEDAICEKSRELSAKFWKRIVKLA